ncbi:MAG: PEP-CTERM sorting domain-containing protein [Candidatus Hydrogenedentes bacterium]|nr:PEP-CTERM sorting domain-containing protein [Candidatus Hydrogenedentota bacterium]
MVKQNGHLVAASALLFFACTAGALTAPFGLPTLRVDAVSITPEPASMLMLGMGLAAIFVRRIGVIRADKQRK